MDTWTFCVTFATVLVAIDGGGFAATPKPTSSSSLPIPKPKLQVVYTAETARNSETVLPEPTNPTTPKGIQGFVNANDFDKFDFGKPEDLFPDFFNSQQPKYSIEVEQEDPYKALSSSVSNYFQDTRRNDKGNEDGFVDPNIRFRSLFDAAETDGGFLSKDFSNYNDKQNENGGIEASKTEQTKAYPSYTYTGRNGDDDDDSSTNYGNPRFTSNYRQVNSGKQTPNENDRRPSFFESSDEPGNNGRDRDSGTRYNPNYGRQQYNTKTSDGRAETSDESAETPQSSPVQKGGKTGDAPSGKSKCKKVMKEVDDAEEFNSGFQQDDYDPSTYQSRYRRQASGRQRGTKRPMTCYVCEDDQGRYAERCSYESNSDPNKKGDYFHSSSTSFNDNGKPRGRDRYKRDPPTFFKLGEISSDDSLPKRIQKRQSQGNRYASDFQEEDGRPATAHQPGHFHYVPSLTLDVGRNARQGNQNNPNRILDLDDFSGIDGRGQDTQNSPAGRFDFDFTIPKEFQQGFTDTSNTENKPVYTDTEGFGQNFDTGYDDYVRKHFPEAFRSTNTKSSSNEKQPSGGAAPPTKDAETFHYRNPLESSSRHFGGLGQGQEFGSSGPTSFGHGSKQYSPPSYQYPTATYYGAEEADPERLIQAISQFNQKDRKDCGKVQKGDMTCYICRDQRGMNKEECMYASNPKDPRNGQMAYHEVSEYSSQPKENSQAQSPFGRAFDQSQGQGQRGEESKKVEKVTKPSVDYDFDY